MLQRPVENMAGINFRQITYPEDLPRELEYIRRLSEGAIDHYRMEKRFLRPDGSTLWADVSLSAIYDETGKAVNYLGMATDIQQKKTDREALIHSEEHFRMLADLPFEGIAVSENGMIIDINTAASTLLGYAKEEMIGRPSTHFLHPDDIEEATRNIIHESETRYEVRLRKKDGTYLPVETKARVLVKDGRHLRVTAFHDISVHKALEQQLRHFNQRLQAQVNEAYLEIYGYSREELIEQPFTRMVKPEERDAAQELHDKFINEELSEIPSRWEVVDKAGDIHFVLVTAARFVDNNGNPFKITTVNDITHYHQVEEKQKIQERFLIQQSKLALMGEMLAAIAHQWRQPLNTLGLIIQDIKEAYDFKELDEAYIRDVEERGMTQIAYMSRTIEDFRHFFTPTRNVATFSLEASIQAVFDLLEKQFTHHNIALTLEGEKEIEVTGNDSEFRQVLINLFNNARDAFLEHNIKERHILVTVSRDQAWIVIAIEDNAGGVDDETLAKLFEPYFTTKGEKGTGIGLYMSRLIIHEGMSGEITVARAHRGLCFTIRLPAP